MNWAHRLGRQLARPQGAGGQLIGAVMDLANRRPTRLALDLLAATPGERVVDLGCGTGAAAARLLRNTACSMTCVERSPTMLHMASRRLAGHAALVEGEIGRLPFEAGAFDAALALNVLYFCDSEGAMLRDVKRVLRPGGRLIAYVTHRQTMASWPFVRHGTHRLFDAGELTAALVAGGFAPTRIQVHDVAVTRSVRGLLAFAEA